MTNPPWWQTAVFYQVYPRSFADGNGDGIGDLPGLISKLDYLRDLGVDAVWLSPHYPSPQVDCGYDIADYCAVDPAYGTLDDFRHLLEAAHRRGLRLVTDLVLNHTSNLHAWFLDSRSGKASPKRDWYIWRPGRGDGPPNNWLSAFGGPAWEFDHATGEYYYHLFFKEQPDLNWRNPAVKQAMWQAARFWLDLGVDGFRLDAIDTIYEHPGLPDHPVETAQEDLRHYLLSASDEQRAEHGDQARLFQYQVNQPGTLALMQELRAIAAAYGDRVLIGESDRLEFLGDGTDALHTVFNFPLMNMKRLRPAALRANQEERLARLPAGVWQANTLGNHDRPRSIQAHSDGTHHQELARVSLALLLILPGIPFLYYGEEIGMTNLLLEEATQIRDRVSLWVYEMLLENGVAAEAALDQALRYGRDQCRTPMQWANAPNAGFSPAGVAPWLPVNPGYARGVNVAGQEGDPASLLNFYKALLRLRKATPALHRGDCRWQEDCPTETLSFLRRDPASGQTALVALNFFEHEHTSDFRLTSPLRCLFSTHKTPNTFYHPPSLVLSPFEVFIGEQV